MTERVRPSRLKEADKSQPTARPHDSQANVTTRPGPANRRPSASAFRRLLDGAREGAALLDGERRIVFANNRLAEMLRLDCDAVMSQPVTNFIAPDEHAAFERLLHASNGNLSKDHLHLTGENTLPLPVELSVQKVRSNGSDAWCLLAVDLSRRQRAEEQLASQAYVLANVSDAVIATDPEQRITYWNVAAEHLYGYSADDVMGRLASEVVRSQATPEARAAYLRTLEAEGQAQIEVVQYDRRGKELLILAASSVLRAPDGRLLGHVSINRDITAQKRAAALAQEHEEQLRQHSEDMMRYAEDMRHYADGMRQHAEERQQHAQQLEQRVRERTAELEAANQALQKEIVARQAELRTRQETEAKLREVFQSLEDTMLAFRESEELLRISIEAAGMVAWTYDPEQDEVVVFARTPDWQQILPKERFPLRGRGLELVHPDDRALVMKTVPRVLAGEPFTVELRLLPPEGAVRWVAVQGRLMAREAGKSPLVMGVVRDVTARRQTNERLQQLNLDLQERTNELEAERARWQGVVEGIADEVWVADAEGKMSLINLPEVTAMGLDEFTGKTIAEVYEEVDILKPDGQLRPQEEAPLLRALQGDIVRGEEIMRHRETGRTRYRQFSAAPTRNAAGQITGAVAIVRDITNLKQAMNTLRKRETTLAQAGQMAHLGAWDIEFYNQQDPNDNPLIWSDEVYRIFGYAPGEVQASNALFFERVHPEDRPLVQQAVAQAFATHQPYSVEHRIVRPDGVERVVREHADIFFDEHGRPARMVGAVQDITEQRQAQQALRESEEQLRTAAEAANIGAWNWNPQTGEVKVSANWKVVFGVSPETNVTFETWQAALHPEDRAAAVNALLFAAEKGTEYNVEYRVVWPDGTVRWIVDRGRGTYDESGRAVNFAGVNVDITERKRIEDALAQSEARFKALYQSLPYMAVVFQKQGDEFVLTDYNQAAMPFTWGGIVKLIGKTAREIYAARPEMCEYIAQAYAEQTSLQIEGPYRLVTTGEEKYTVSTFVYVSPDRVLLHVEDITERKRAEEEIKTLARFPAENPNPVLRLDAAGRILFANDASEPVLNGWQAAVGGAVPESLREIVAHAFQTQQGRVIEVEIRDRIYSFNIAPVPELGYINLYGRDITDRKRAENQVKQLNRDLERRATELEIANRELESFSYSVSHDLRTPLASVRIFSSILQDDYGAQLPENAQHYVNMIRANTAQMEELITSLLALSRLSRQPLQKRPVSMTELVREALETLPEEARRPDLTIEAHDMPVVEADPVLLKQVWVNLIANAVKFTRKCGNARIEIGCEPRDGEERVFYVRDNGVGFDMSQADKLFGVFQRLHSEEEYEGTGIGLAIVAHIIRRHGGRVWAEAQVGEGATFYFTLG